MFFTFIIIAAFFLLVSLISYSFVLLNNFGIINRNLPNHRKPHYDYILGHFALFVSGFLCFFIVLTHFSTMNEYKEKLRELEITRMTLNTAPNNILEKDGVINNMIEWNTWINETRYNNRSIWTGALNIPDEIITTKYLTYSAVH
jgi:hypothetical protein